MTLLSTKYLFYYSFVLIHNKLHTMIDHFLFYLNYLFLKENYYIIYYNYLFNKREFNKYNKL